MDYKEKIRLAKEALDSGSYDKETIEYIFPELKESEDERIRKSIIGFLKTMASLKDGKTVSNEDFDSKALLEWADWLEKQRKKLNIPQDTEDDLRRQSTIQVLEYARSLDAYNQYGKEDIDKDISWLEKQGEKFQYWNPSEQQLEALDYAYNLCPDTERGNYYEGVLETLIDDLHKLSEKQREQKSTDKVESKFKVGDWIVQEGVGTYKVVEVCKWYEVIGIDGNQYSISFLQENGCHLWTIRDARDGDMLTTHMSPAGDWIGIYKQSTDDMFKTHCFLSAVGEFVINPNRCRNHGTHGLYPATKEQRDLLFKKMKEAGYEWDAEEKKMRKIGQKASIDFSDLKTWKYIVDAILTKEHGIGQYLDNGRTEIMAKELQERFGNIMQNPAWSKEEHISVIEKDGEQWVRVCALGEDFIVAAHDYKDGDKTEFTWEEACNIGTFSKRQGLIMLALLDEINARLEEIGGEPLDSYYWSSSEYSSYDAWYVSFNSGYVSNRSYKSFSYVARAVAAF